jgi:hypothetical protein
MNAEELIHLARAAIVVFSKHQRQSCFLTVRNGIVLALPSNKAPAKYPSCLFLSRDEQIHGLSKSDWKSIGSSLLRFYNTEKSCQTHPKP